MTFLMQFIPISVIRYHLLNFTILFLDFIFGAFLYKFLTKMCMIIHDYVTVRINIFPEMS